MKRWCFWCALIALSTSGFGCEKARGLVCDPVVKAAVAKAIKNAPKAAPDAKNAAAAKDDHDDSDDSDDKDDSAAPQAGQQTALTSGPQHDFALPFAWEKSPQEPLARARKYLREVADDNATYMTKGADFFKPFVNAQAPRATVLTCADSRVQPGAYDATPENDDFTVRNLGNQVRNSLGSLQYGIDALHTPVLLILGHTGCSAVKEAMGHTTGMPEAIRRELAGLRTAKSAGKGGFDDRKWLMAVLDNVHAQVKAALHEFGAEVNAGNLTIVGAVYDFRNDLGHGHGRLAVIDVNGVQDPARLKSFVEAIMSGPSSPSADDALGRLARALADPGPPGEQGPDEQVVPSP